MLDIIFSKKDKKSSKIGQDQETLIFAFCVSFDPYCKKSISVGKTGYRSVPRPDVILDFVMSVVLKVYYTTYHASFIIHTKRCGGSPN